jgi:uncharacterized protein YecE (DUF72 family)
MIYVGTSGFKFDDWKGHFYPEDLKEKNWLEYYSQRFNCLEINSTYYRLMHPATFFHMANKVPEQFEFTVKAYRSLTHEAGTDNEADFSAFIDSIQPLLEASKFGCVLAQFPTSFHNTPGSRAYLTQFCDRFSEYPLVVEFRNREWVKDEVFAFMRERQVGWCAVDEPQFRSLMPPLVEVTSPLGYVRFHGRNYRQWWAKDSKLRYDYLYSREELGEWVPKIQGLAKQTQKVYVFMNNCFQGQAATNAIELRDLLQGSGTTVV